MVLYGILVALSAVIVGVYVVWNLTVRPPEIPQEPDPAPPAGSGSQAAEPVEKELNLMVTEEMETEFDPSLTMDPELMEPEKPSFFEAYKMWILMGGAAAAGAVGFVTVRHIRKKRRAAKEKEDIEDEIS